MEVFVGLRDRINKSMEDQEKAIVEAMQGGEEGDEGGDRSTARLQPIRPRHTRKRTRWAPILHNVSHCYIVLCRTLRMMPSGKDRIVLEQVTRDLEKSYADLSKRTQTTIEIQ